MSVLPAACTLARRLGAGVALMALLAGCTTEFDPRAETDSYFTLWGYLDAEADTQWVRVSPVRETVDPLPGPLDATVVLERVGTGERTPLRDSLFTFSNGLVAHNYWTTEPVVPDELYRLGVERADGAETVATVQVPGPFPAPEVDDGVCTCPTTVAVRGVERLVDVQTMYRYQTLDGEVRTFSFSKARDIEEQPDGSFLARIYFGDDALEMGLDPLQVTLAESHVLVAAGTDDWPDLSGLDPESAALPVPNERIENGLGFLGGAYTKVLPFAPGLGSCPSPGGGSATPCLSRR